MPAVPMKRPELFRPNVERSWGRSFSRSPIDGEVDAAMSCSPTCTSGVGASKLVRASREPVTTSSSRIVASSVSPSSCWAKATGAAAADANAVAAASTRYSRRAAPCIQFLKSLVFFLCNVLLSDDQCGVFTTEQEYGSQTQSATDARLCCGNQTPASGG